MRIAAIVTGLLIYLVSFQAPAQGYYPYGQPQMVSAQQRAYLAHLPQTVVMRQHVATGQTVFHHANQLVYPHSNLGYQLANWNFHNAAYGQFRNYGYNWNFSYYAYPYGGTLPYWYNNYPMWNYWNGWSRYYNSYMPYYGNTWYVPTYYYGGYNYAYQYYYYYNWGGYNYYFYRSPWWW